MDQLIEEVRFSPETGFTITIRIEGDLRIVFRIENKIWSALRSSPNELFPVTDITGRQFSLRVQPNATDAEGQLSKTCTVEVFEQGQKITRGLGMYDLSLDEPTGEQVAVGGFDYYQCTCANGVVEWWYHDVYIIDGVRKPLSPRPDGWKRTATAPGVGYVSCDKNCAFYQYLSCCRGV